MVPSCGSHQICCLVSTGPASSLLLYSMIHAKSLCGVNSCVLESGKGHLLRVSLQLAAAQEPDVSPASVSPTL